MEKSAVTEHLSERLSRLLQVSGLKKKYFAEKAFISPSLISEVLSGRSQISERTAKSICNAFSVNVEWLLTGEGDMLKRTAPDRPLELTETKKGPDAFSRIAERRAPNYTPAPLTKGQRLLQAFALLDEERQERLIAMAEDMSTALLRGSDQEGTGRGTNCAGSNEK